MLARPKSWAAALSRNVRALWLAARDPRVALAPKIVAGAVAAYALSPIDLIPDFIPVLGLLDDLLIVPVGIWFAMRLIPKEVLVQLQARADAEAPDVSPYGALAVIVIWIAAATAIGVWLWR